MTAPKSPKRYRRFWQQAVIVFGQIVIVGLQLILLGLLVRLVYKVLMWLLTGHWLEDD